MGKCKKDGDVSIPITYHVELINPELAKDYIKENHYSRGSHNAPYPCYGLYDGYNLIGVLMYSTPCSENVRSSIYGEDRKNEVIELSRLHILDITPRNTESWFISRTIKRLKIDKPEITAIVSFSDLTENHQGIIYQATGFKLDGKTSKSRFYRDDMGRLRHPRQNGKNITVSEALKMGWKVENRLSKNRYIKIIKEKKKEHNLFTLEI